MHLSISIAVYCYILYILCTPNSLDVFWVPWCYLITTNFKYCLWSFKWGSCNGGSCGRFLFSVASFVVSDAVLSHISNKLWVQLSVNGCGDSKWILSQAVQTSHMHPWSVLNSRQPIHDLCCITSQCTLRLYGYSFFFQVQYQLLGVLCCE